MKHNRRIVWEIKFQKRNRKISLNKRKPSEKDEEKNNARVPLASLYRYKDISVSCTVFTIVKNSGIIITLREAIDVKFFVKKINDLFINIPFLARCRRYHDVTLISWSLETRNSLKCLLHPRVTMFLRF